MKKDLLKNKITKTNLEIEVNTSFLLLCNNRKKKTFFLNCDDASKHPDKIL